MRAVVFNAYGGNDVLGTQEVPKPEIKSDEVLIRVHAAGVNPLTGRFLRGRRRYLPAADSRKYSA